ncbi:UDP-N-acetyl glucosamine 2-epimerase [Actinosynnema sp. NPDC053489]|uniref:UDP-N-acetyl glucosamine 2-epimerase n=1 Tax=Actinosynnema sp. NPDC053489 TaxID=3363916 RepID=UPI0037CA470F
MTAVLEHTDRRAAPPAAAQPRTGSVAVVLGTRPEVFRLAPVLGALGGAARLVRPGRSPLPDAPLPGFPDTIRSCAIAVALERLQHDFTTDRPDAVLVSGDSDVALAGALAARSRGLPLVRVDAGVRDHDLGRTEEHNRVLLDRMADVLCAPTPLAVDTLRAEGLGDRDVRLTGDTTVEAVRHRLRGRAERLAVLRAWGLEEDDYVVATIGRAAHVDDEEALFSLVNQLAGVVDAGHPVVLPVDPRTKAAVLRTGVLAAGVDLRLADRLWHSEFLALARHAGVVVTDSGTVQAEATVLKRPVLAVGRTTERPEALAGFGTLVGPEDDLTSLALDRLSDHDLRARLADVPSPFGDGRGGDRIAAAALALVGTNVRR